MAPGKRPLIGVTGPDRGGLAMWLFTWWAVRSAGGRARRITHSRPFSASKLDGLVLGGGADVDPKLYKQERQEIARHIKRNWRISLVRSLFFPLIYLLRKLFSSPKADALDNARDDLEKSLLAAAIKRSLPVLGICRGAQLINVTLGGSLHQDLSGFYVETPAVRSILPRKQVLLKPESRLSEILQTHECLVNALHRQAIDLPGRNVRIVAREPNDVVQGIEVDNAPFLLGVQWHPEFMPQHSRQRKLFRALVSQARKRAETPSKSS